MKWLMAVLLASGGAFSITVSPGVILAGGAVRIICRVPELPESSQDTLEIGIEGYTSSVYEIHGTPWTKEVIIQKVPCDAGDAFCAIVQDKDTRIAKALILVSGCEGP